ncbi:MAG: sigma-70 family RNA polymerase sigma factor [Lachnospiraceae bacterium]
MHDDKIVSLYFARDEAAIRETEQKYGKYLLKVAYNILHDYEDCRESVNDTYLNAWKSIPPQKPDILSTYLAKITRRISIDILRKKSRGKRLPSEYTVSLSELADTLKSSSTTEQEIDARLLAKAINDFLKTLPCQTRDIFICRYYFADSIKSIAAFSHMGESKIKSLLYRTRNKLRLYLEEEEFYEI